MKWFFSRIQGSSWGQKSWSQIYYIQSWFLSIVLTTSDMRLRRGFIVGFGTTSFWLCNLGKIIIFPNNWFSHLSKRDEIVHCSACFTSEPESLRFNIWSRLCKHKLLSLNSPDSTNVQTFSIVRIYISQNNIYIYILYMLKEMNILLPFTKL